MPAENWQVFEINDCDWWLARSEEEARKSAAAFYGCKPEDEDQINKEVKPLSEAQLEKHKFYEERHQKGPRTFKQELQRRIASGPTVEMFATTEF